MTFLRYLFLGLLALILLVLALANRAPVTLRIVPDDMMALFGGTGMAATMPLFVVIFLAIALGLLIGFTWEWLREHKHRAEARHQRAERERLEKQLARSRTPSEQDDVLALVERPR
jgi:uncharacterized integral membrane protein